MPYYSSLTLDSLATAVILVDSALHVVYLNQAAESLFEVSGKNLLGNSLNVIFTDTGQLASAMQQAVENNVSYIEHELMLVTHLHNKLQLRCAVTPLHGNQLLLEFHPMELAAQAGARRADAGSDTGQSFIAA